MIESAVLEDLINTLERAANERPGLGSALRALAEARSADLFEVDDPNPSWDRVTETIERLARALVATALSRSSGIDDRVQRLLVEIVSITIGEGNDLSRMVDVQSEARAILDDSTN